MTFEESITGILEMLSTKVETLEAKASKTEESAKVDEEQKANEPDPEVINAFIQNI